MKKALIIGVGGSGLMTAYQLALNSDMQVIMVDKGPKYLDRISKGKTELLCGEGGAGTIYGGKLCFPPASSGVWKRTGFREEEFSAFCKNYLGNFIKGIELPENFASSKLLFKKNSFFQKNYDSILLNKSEMNKFILNILLEVRKLGVDINTSCEFIDYKKTKDGFLIKCIRDGVEVIEDCVDYIIFASGRLSSERIAKWFGTQGGIKLQNPDLGIRLSIDYDRTEIFKEIGKDVKLKAKVGDIGLRTFCVCSGGSKAVVNLNGIKYYDGHFEDKMTREVNLGILARSPYIYGFEGAALYCSYMRDYLNLDWSLKDFVKNSDRLIKETSLFDDVLEAITQFICMMQRERILGENLDNYPVWLPSVDKLNPIIYTNQHFETVCKNIYVVGDAVGISRGFVQSMWSGYCAGKHISETFEGKVQWEKIRA